MIISPEIKELNCYGKFSYDENKRAWSIMKLKKEIIQMFPILKERRNHIGYRMKLFLSLQSFNEYSNKVSSKELPVPIIMYIERIEDEKKP